LKLKILADTNILISALLYPKSKPSIALLHAARHQELILSDYNVAEFRRVSDAKFAKTQSDIDVFLAEFAFSLVIAPHEPSKLISDPKDAPVLNAAIIADADIIISGDKHFLSLALEHPAVMTATKYLEYVGAEE
jgi:putative PIN family toxin of toxin-antitoxin system